LLSATESWHNSAALSNSKAELQSYANELIKELGMKYHAPPLPIDASLESQSHRPSFFPRSEAPNSPNQEDVEAGHRAGPAGAAAALFETQLSP
jgi:hypothetical protein